MSRARRNHAAASARRKRSSIVLGAAIQAALIGLSVLLSKTPIAGALVWNLKLGLALAGPLELVGYTKAGKEYHAATPMHLVTGTFGLALGVALYSLACWWLLKARSERNEGRSS